MIENSFEAKMVQFKTIIEKSPSVSHLYIKRVGKQNDVIDIPVNGIEATLRLHPDWEIVGSNKAMEDKIEKLFEEPSETIYLCPLCDFKGKTEAGLKTHKTTRHA